MDVMAGSGDGGGGFESLVDCHLIVVMTGLCTRHALHAESMLVVALRLAMLLWCSNA